MGNLEQTPVDWLIAQLTESGHLWITDKPDDMDELSLIIKKAKQMEAIELFKTYCNGFNKSRTALVFNKRDSYARLHLKEKFNIDFIKIIRQKL
jgi:predicted helicase